jgi:NAD(P)-dependent dehydrogenase (short-subunit alcohol dehydrogenase family)
MKSLDKKVALVAGATRGAGRAIAIELGLAGAITYVTGRSTRLSSSPMQRPETIEETAELITAGGGKAIPLRVDHTLPEEVAALMQRIREEQAGRLDILVNDVWGGDPLATWGVTFWEHDLEAGLLMQHNAVHSHIITSWYAAPLMVERKGGLIIEVTDGITDRYRGSLFYDLVKASVIRLAVAQAEDLRPFNVAAVALSPGFLRSEAMLEHFGVTESNWRDAIAKDPNFAISETPHFIGRAVVALASDPDIMSKSGKALATWNLAREYGFTDIDGSQPDWGSHARRELGLDMG